jgi:Phosphotransferase enzyme family
MTLPLPLAVDQITAEWLDQALFPPGSDGGVDSIQIEDTLWGTGTKALIRVRYSGEANGHDLPEGLVVKGCFNEVLRPVVGRMVQNEAIFYRHYAPSLQMPLPSCFFAATEPERDQGVVILEDLRPQHVTFGQPGYPFTPDMMAEAVEHLASLHGTTWGGDFSNLGPGATEGLVMKDQRAAIVDWCSRSHWDRFIDRPQAAAMVGEFRDPTRVLEGLRRKWQFDDQALNCLCHCDCHIKNMYLDGAGKPRFIDWQIVTPMNWAHDFSLTLLSALTIEDRRAHERELLRHYLDALETHGGPRIDFDSAFLAYTRESLQSVIWGLCPEEMQPERDVTLMCERGMAAALDHDLFAALGLN